MILQCGFVVCKIFPIRDDAKLGRERSYADSFSIIIRSKYLQDLATTQICHITIKSGAFNQSVVKHSFKRKKEGCSFKLRLGHAEFGFLSTAVQPASVAVTKLERFLFDLEQILFANIFSSIPCICKKFLT